MTDISAPEKKDDIFIKDWTKGPILRNILLLSWPMALLETLFVVAQLADMIWVGRLGSAAIASMGVSFTLMMLAISVDFGLVTGARAMVARYVGAGDIRTANHVAAQGIIVGLAWSALMTATGVTLAEPLIRLFGVDDSVVAYGVNYVRIMFGGWVTMNVMVMAIYTVQSSGDTIRPMLIESLTRVIHVVLCPFLVLGIGIFPLMGVGGAALASVIGQVIGMILVLGLLFGGNTRLHITRKDFRPDFSVIGRILKIGLPSLLTNLQKNIAGLIIILLIASFGTTAVAAQSLYTRLEMFILLPGFGLGMGAGVMVGQNLGAGQPQRAEKSAWQAAIILEIFMVVCCAVIILWANGIVSLFTTDPEIIKQGSVFLRIAVAGFSVLAFLTVPQGSVLGAGDTVRNLILSLVVIWAVQMPLAFWLPHVHGLDVVGIRWALATGNVAGAILFTTYFAMGKWKHKKV